MPDLGPIAITGVSRGLGRALCDALVRKGATIAGCARNLSAIEQLRDVYPPPHRFDQVDVIDAAAVQDWADDVQADVPPLRLLINNAGYMNECANLWEIEVDDFQRVMDVNLRGMFHAIRAFVPKMVELRTGGIVNLSSGWGTSTSPHVAPYCASKWGVEGLTQALAQELPTGVFAVAVSPGVVHTEMLEKCMGDSAASYTQPEAWGDGAAEFMLSLSTDHNGRSMRIA